MCQVLFSTLNTLAHVIQQKQWATAPILHVWKQSQEAQGHLRTVTQLADCWAWIKSLFLQPWIWVLVNSQCWSQIDTIRGNCLLRNLVLCYRLYCYYFNSQTCCGSLSVEDFLAFLILCDLENCHTTWLYARPSQFLQSDPSNRKHGVYCFKYSSTACYIELYNSEVPYQFY